MSKDDLVYVAHMPDIAHKIQTFVQDKDRAAFDADEPLRIALTHLLQVIGEAARHISEPFQEAHPAIPWKAIVGLRHRVVHDYLNVDEDIVWETSTLRIPELIVELERILPPEQEPGADAT